MEMVYEVNSPEETRALGEKLSEGFESGTVIALVGDLGVGKTHFTQGVADGLGVGESVASPTFTIICEYEEGRLPLYHMDVYRIEDEDELFEIGFEDYLYSDGVVIIEWADLIPNSMPDKYTKILIEKDLAKGLSYRRITVSQVI